ncbi:MAG: PEP-CTERM sorting domain-containing protein [Planctomycetota bacterium]|nr:PEP-CTERM sorting domain-containing protein [Planctomycetota bacterium]
MISVRDVPMMAVVSAMVLLAPAISHAQMHCIFNDLGPGQAQKINNEGQIVGYAMYGSQAKAILWQGGVTTRLDYTSGNSNAFDINDCNQVVGQEYDTGNGCHAFIWQNNQLSDLSIGYGLDASAIAINNTGDIAGNYTYFYAFRLSNGVYSQMTSGQVYSRVYDMNESGKIVGKKWTTSGGTERPFVWNPDGTWYELSVVGQAGAYAINDHGEVVGFRGADAARRATYWDAVGNLTILPDLYGRFCEANDINNLGDIVGTQQKADGTWRPLLWKDGQVYDLLNITTVPAGYTIETALAINDSEQIVCWAWNQSGEHRLIRLDVIPEPATLTLVALGGLAMMRRRGRK